MEALLDQTRDPISRAFRPIFSDGAVIDRGPPRSVPQATPFDEALGRRLTTLLDQPLSKPTLLRALALAASTGVVLKVLGVGREGGRPALLALSSEHDGPVRPLREEAVQAFKRGVAALDGAVALRLLKRDPVWSTTGAGDAVVDVKGSGVKLGTALVDALRARRDEEKPTIYWPDQFAKHLGRKVGCVRPLDDRAGWGSHLALTPELVDVLVLTSVPPGKTSRPWTQVWQEIRADLGVVVGAEPAADARVLADAGVRNVSREKLEANAEALLREAVRRGVARRLPDGGAEAIGARS
jgi:hypothetical protein